LGTEPLKPAGIRLYVNRRTTPQTHTLGQRRWRHLPPSRGLVERGGPATRPAQTQGPGTETRILACPDSTGLRHSQNCPLTTQSHVGGFFASCKGGFFF